MAFKVKARFDTFASKAWKSASKGRTSKQVASPASLCNQILHVCLPAKKGSQNIYSDTHQKPLLFCASVL